MYKYICIYTCTETWRFDPPTWMNQACTTCGVYMPNSITYRCICPIQLRMRRQKLGVTGARFSHVWGSKRRVSALPRLHPVWAGIIHVHPRMLGKPRLQAARRAARYTNNQRHQAGIRFILGSLHHSWSNRCANSQCLPPRLLEILCALESLETHNWCKFSGAEHVVKFVNYTTEYAPCHSFQTHI